MNPALASKVTEPLPQRLKPRPFSAAQVCTPEGVLHPHWIQQLWNCSSTLGFGASRGKPPVGYPPAKVLRKYSYHTCTFVILTKPDTALRSRKGRPASVGRRTLTRPRAR